MSLNFIGSTSVGDAPRIVAVIAGRPEQFPDLAQKAKDEGADILEFRADFCFGVLTADEIRDLVRSVKQISSLPILLTIREFPEGGYFAGTEAERLSLFEHLLPEVDAIDCEIYASDIRDRLVELAHQSGKFVVLSYHNFTQTPRLGKIEEVAKHAVDFKADMIKIAVTAKHEEDVKTVSRFTMEFDKDILITTISMGEVGTVSRVLNPFLGSCFTFGFVGATPTTPGQIRISTLRKLMDEFADEQISDVAETEGLIHSAIQAEHAFA